MRNITRASLLASIISAIELYEDGPQRADHKIENRIADGGKKF